MFFGDAHGGKGMSGTKGLITFAKTGYRTVGPFWGQFGSEDLDPDFDDVCISILSFEF